MDSNASIHVVYHDTDLEGSATWSPHDLFMEFDSLAYTGNHGPTYVQLLAVLDALYRMLDERFRGMVRQVTFTLPASSVESNKER